MTKQDVASLALNLTGLWVLLWAGIVSVTPLTHMAITFSRSGRFQWDEFATTVVVTTVAVAMVWVAGGLILRSDRLARWLFPLGEPSTEAASAPSATDYQTIALSVLGAYLAIAGLAGVARMLGSTLTYLSLDSSQSMTMYARYLVPQGFAMVLQVALGWYLFVRPRQVTALWQRLQRPQENDA